VTIGNNVLFAPNVSIYTAGHPLHAELRNQDYEYAFPVTIGNNVWIGGNVVINPGITIGDNTVIGSGSVVTRDIPADVIAVGNPCKVLRKITEDDKLYYFKTMKF
jgi:maltose O-acetyltransferase